MEGCIKGPFLCISTCKYVGSSEEKCCSIFESTGHKFSAPFKRGKSVFRGISRRAALENSHGVKFTYLFAAESYNFQRNFYCTIPPIGIQKWTPEPGKLWMYFFSNTHKDNAYIVLTTALKYTYKDLKTLHRGGIRTRDLVFCRWTLPRHPGS
jgi:hypothetical protein